MDAFTALHKYFIWANRFRDLFDHDLTQHGAMQGADPRDFFIRDRGIFMSYWYAALHVVVEGYRELGFNDTVVDQLLTSPNAALLRRYRNGVFHFQKDYFDARFERH